MISWRMLGFSGVGLSFLLFAGCSGDESAPGGQGNEGQPCYPNHTCEPGLTCASNLCVNLGDASSGGSGTGGSGTGGSGTGGSATGGKAGSSGGASGGTAGSGGASGASSGGTDGGADASSDKDGGRDGTLDGAPTPACDLVAQTGCATGKKCALVKTMAGSGGDIACVPDGTVAVNGACTFGAPGASTGYDNCKKGGICTAGACEAICDPKALPGAQHACATGFTCSVPSNLSGAGLCDPTCDPLTQKRAWDNAAACGSPNPGAPTMGCYGLPNGIFTCAPAGPAANTSDVVLSGPPFGNACAPGYVPLLRQSWQSSAIICVAYCQPGPTSQAAPQNAAGLTTSPYTCPAKGAGGTHECHYWWAVEDPSKPSTPQSNTLGFCIDPTQYKYDPNDPSRVVFTALDPNWPSCASLSSSDPDYGIWGCAPQ